MNMFNVNNHSRSARVFTYDDYDNCFRKCGQWIALTDTEHHLMTTFFEHIDEVLSPEMLMSLAWGHHDTSDTRIVAVNVQRLRQKIEDNPHNPRYIITVRKQGYRFVNPWLTNDHA